jgi:hypothetical protein
MEFAILAILIAIRYGMDRDQATEIGTFISAIFIMFGLLWRPIKARLCPVINSITGVYGLRV